MTSKKTHVRVASKQIDYYGRKAVITATACLHQIGEQAPYFSVTAEIKIPVRRDVEACGCLHDEIKEHFPSWAAIVPMHLSSVVGTPLHAEANGWYWMAGALGGEGERYHGGNGTLAKSPDECLAVWADHVRVPVDQANLMREVIRLDDKPREMHGRILKCMLPRWHDEAKRAIAWLDDKPA